MTMKEINLKDYWMPRLLHLALRQIIKLCLTTLDPFGIHQLILILARNLECSFYGTVTDTCLAADLCRSNLGIEKQTSKINHGCGNSDGRSTCQDALFGTFTCDGLCSVSNIHTQT